jgi:hypothetical protein
MRIMKKTLILFAVLLISSCTPVDMLKDLFKKPSGGGGGGGFSSGPNYTGQMATDWLNSNVNSPDTSCSGVMLQPAQVYVTPSSGGSWKREWTDGLIKAMDDHPYSQILEKGVFSDSYMKEIGCETFNHRLNREQKKRIVIQHLAEMCRPESKYNPKLIYTEGPAGNRWTNYGLCQMTPKTVNLPAYGCNVTKNDLLDPVKNLKCALLVLNHNMRKLCNGRFPCSKTYWGPMRRSGQSNAAKVNMRIHNDKLHPYCSSSNWNGLDRRTYAEVGEQSDNLQAGCQVVDDKPRNLPDFKTFPPMKERTLKEAMGQ